MSLTGSIRNGTSVFFHLTRLAQVAASVLLLCWLCYRKNRSRAPHFMAMYKSSQLQREVHQVNTQKEKLIITKENIFPYNMSLNNDVSAEGEVPCQEKGKPYMTVVRNIIYFRSTKIRYHCINTLICNMSAVLW